MIGGRIWVNGAELPPIGDAEGAVLRRRATIDQRRAHPALRFGAALTVPYVGYRLRLDSATAIRWGSLIQEEGSTIEFSNRIVFVDGLPATYYTFRRDYFFALGDNSPNSLDSRYFGFVPVDNLVGQATIIYWSREPGGRIRWERIGRVIE
jgi:signal peptidase I